jgi:hypothetical protein
LFSLHRAGGYASALHRDYQTIPESLVVPFGMIVGDEFSNGIPQSIFAEEDHATQTLFFDGLHEAFSK